jgi:hypothetical protein
VQSEIMFWAVKPGGSFRQKKHAIAVAGCLAALSLPLACEPRLVVGKLSCSDPDASGGETSQPSVFEPIATPWSTSFEQGFCDYAASNGFCYADPSAVYETVTFPVHSGKLAAAFRITTGAPPTGDHQTRCVRQGSLPSAARYSAYFYIPAAPIDAVNWNLIHFRGGDGPVYHGLWDVSLAKGPDGEFHVVVFDFLRSLTRTTNAPPVPVGTWFQLAVDWKRAADETGSLAVYQDGQLVLELTDLSTDDTNRGQFYVGNLAVSLNPRESTLYVDDVAIQPAP